MKTTAEIANEFLSKVTKLCNNAPTNYIGDDGGSGHWKIYRSISGFYGGSDYFDVYFREDQHNKYTVEFAHTTHNPERLIELLKEIEPELTISYSVVKKTYKTVTIN